MKRSMSRADASVVDQPAAIARTAPARTEIDGRGGGAPRPMARRLKIGEVARLADVGIEALRFYEKSGLLDRPGRTESGYRLYAEDVLERIAFIKKSQALGFSLEEIRRLISHKRDGESPCAEVRGVVRARLSELNVRIEQLIRYRDDLEAELAAWDEKGSDEGHVCGLIENSRVESRGGTIGKAAAQVRRAESLIAGGRTPAGGANKED